MLKWFQKLFPKERLLKTDVPLAQLESWLAEQLATKDICTYSKEYIKQIQLFQKQLREKAEILKQHEITADDKQQVDVSVQNVVKGHRDHYAREIQRFAQELVPAVNLNQLAGYQALWQFNQELQQKMDALSKSTHKSYQATQHLFFDEVEEIFRLLGGLNNLTKSFRADKIAAVQNLTSAIAIFREEQQKRDVLSQQINQQSEKISQILSTQQESRLRRTALMQSPEYMGYLQLEQAREQLRARQKEVEDAIHSFFAKLQKPLKKYERMAQDTALVRAYLADSIDAFKQDYELRILNSLEGLAKNLQSHHLEVEEKLRKNYLDLIHQHSLRALHDKIISLRQEEAKLEAEFKQNKVQNELQKIERELALGDSKINPASAEREDVLVKVGKLNVERKKEMVAKLIKEMVGVEVEIQE